MIKTIIELEGQTIYITGVSGNSKDGCFLDCQNDLKISVSYGIYCMNSPKTWMKSDKQAGFAKRIILEGKIEFGVKH